MQIRLSPFHVSFPDFLGYLMILYYWIAVFRYWGMGLVFIFLGGFGGGLWVWVGQFVWGQKKLG